MIKIKNLHLHYHAASGVSLEQLNSLKAEIMATLNEVIAAVTEQTGKVDSLKVFVSGLEAQIADVLSQVGLSAEDQAAIDAVFAGVNANSAGISAAIDNDPATV